MRLVKHPSSITGMLPSYTIVGVSAMDLAYLQLLLIENGQPELRLGEDWVSKDDNFIPKPPEKVELPRE